MPARKPRPLREYPIRTCRTMHDCCVCGGTIRDGEQYHDGGYGRRAHTSCVNFSVEHGKAVDSRLANGLSEDPYDEPPGGYNDFGAYQKAKDRGDL